MDSTTTHTVKTGVQLAGEVVFPGGSNFINGDFVQGGIYAFLGVAARAVFGLPGLLIVSADSFARATTGHNIVEHLKHGPQVAHHEPAEPPKQ
jgi:hypothetical protein